MSGHDLITVGRVGVDLYPLRSGVPLSEVDKFARFLGGSATNVAVAAARLGRRSAVVTRTGADPFGDFVHEALKGFGVDDAFVSAVPGLPTPITFCEIFPPDDFPLYFYRWPKAPDLEIQAAELDRAALGDARIVWLTVTGLCAQPSRDAHHAIAGWRAGKELVLDLDYRPMFWPGPQQASQAVREVLDTGVVSIAVGNRQECEIATGHADPDAAADALLAKGVRLAVIKQGPDGVLVKTAGARIVVPPVPVEVVNGLGAGDAFGGALCHGLLAGWPLEQVVRFANAAGAHVAARLACSAAMPTSVQVQALIGEAP